MTIRAFNLSEKYRTPVILSLDEIIGHMRENVIEDDEIEIIDRKKPTCSPDEYKAYEVKKEILYQKWLILALDIDIMLQA